MRWKVPFILALMLLIFFLSQIAELHAQTIFDPFGLRNRNRKGSSTERSSEEERSGSRPHLPFPFLNPFSRENSQESNRGKEKHGGHGRGRQESSEEETELRSPTSRSRSRPSRPSDQSSTNTNSGRSKPSGEHRSESLVPQPRMIPGGGGSSHSSAGSTLPEQSEKQPHQSQPQYYGPCGPNNSLCIEDYINILGLKWRPQVHNGTGIYIFDKSAPGKKRFVPVGIEQPNEKFGFCTTPEEERGYCRHLEHCVLDEFRSNFLVFLQYQCDIPNMNYVGVCCPDPELEESKEQRNDKENDTPMSRSDPRFTPEMLPFPFNQFPPPPFFGRPTTTTPRPRVQTTHRSRNRQTTRSNARSLQPPNCGVNGNGMHLRAMPRIVGGRPAKPDDWPWMVALLKKSEAVDYRSGQFCGGVLISEFHVLSAAHCVDGFAKDNLAARIGEYDFSKNSGATEDIDLSEIFVHERFNRYTYENDIAILRLAKSAFFHERIKVICLPLPEDDGEALVNEKGHVAGFGTIYYGGPASDQLMEIVVPIWSQEDCQNAYTQPINDTNLCAGVRAGSRDSCQGDSGGPLQMERRGRFTVVGIVSWGIKCSEPGYPGVYTRVTKYLNWIEKKMQKGNS